jgi:hypothetical protein
MDIFKVILIRKGRCNFCDRESQKCETAYTYDLPIKNCSTIIQILCGNDEYLDEDMTCAKYYQRFFQTNSFTPSIIASYGRGGKKHVTLCEKNILILL